MESKIKDLRQEIFKFEQLSNFDKDDFFVSECNYFAFNLIKSWPNWEKKILNIIEKSKIFFEDIWKQNNQINTSIKLPINISVNSKKVKQIQLIENYLAQLDLVSNFYITSFNNNNTIYKIIFNGNPNQFLTLMKEKDIDIDTNQEIWKVR